MMRPTVACLVAGLLAGCSSGGPPYIATSLPPAFLAGQAVPAGDVVPMSASRAQTRRSTFVEYPWTAHLADTVHGVRWSVESGDAATVDERGMLHARRPGSVVLIARAGNLGGRLSVSVGWPLDSVAFHFAAPEVMVGDTVELVFRRHYATGEVAPRGARLWVDEKDELTGGPNMAFMGKVAHEANLVPVRPADPRKPDTVAFVARAPGRIAAMARVQGRDLRAELRVVPLAGRTPRFHMARPAPSVRWRDRRPVGCWALAYGEWRSGGSDDGWFPSEPLTAEQREDIAFLPARVELDSMPVIPWAPDVGRRIGAVGDDRLVVERWWQVAGDSLRLRFESPENRSRSVSTTMMLRRVGDRLVGEARGTIHGPVTGRPIRCDP